MRVCVVSRTEELPTKSAKVQGRRLRGDPTHLNPKGRGESSMLGKRGMSEDVYGMVPRHLSNKVKTGLFELESPVVERHTRR